MPLYTARAPIVIPFRIAYSSAPWTDMPAALTEWNASLSGRIKYDLSNVSQVRVFCRMVVAGAASAELRGQYSTDDSTFNYLDGGTGPTVAINAANTTVVGAWVTIVAAARADVILRIVGINGDGALDPTFANFGLEVR